jgi:hypothetical protein
MERFHEFYRWGAGLGLDEIPGSVQRLARLQMLNMLAACMEGLRSGEAPEGRDPLFCLTTATMVHDFDDFLYYSHSGHSSVLVSLLCGARVDAPLSAVLGAQVAANEIAGRLGGCLLLGPHNGQMWSSTHIPAALVSAGRLLGVDEGRLAQATLAALAHAPFVVPAYFFSSPAKFYTASVPIMLSLGLLENLRTNGSLPGPAARGRAFMKSFSYLPLDGFLSHPGRPWLTSTLHFKRYPACAYAQAGIDAGRKIREPAGEIRRLRILADPLALAMHAMQQRHDRGVAPFQVRAAFNLKTAVACAVLQRPMRCDLLTEAWRSANRGPLASLEARMILRPDLGRAAGLLRRAAGSILLPGLGIRSVSTAPLDPLELRTRIEVETSRGGGYVVEGRFPSYAFDDEEDTAALVTAKYEAAHRAFNRRVDPDGVLDLVLGPGDAPARDVIRISLGRKWLDKILKWRFS